VGCERLENLDNNIRTLPIPLIVSEDEDLIETVDELDEIIAYMSDNFVMSTKVQIRSLELWEELDRFYDENAGVLAKRGIRGIEISYIERRNFLVVDIFPRYEMFMNVIIAHETSNREHLSEEENAIYDMAIFIIQELISDEMSSFDKALTLHDYLTENIEYDHNYEENENAFNAYGALIEGWAVCQGYVHAYKMLLHMVGVENLIVTGVAGGENHAWNLVNYYGQWYHVDVTWNDQEEIASKRYFNVNDDMLSASHEWDTLLYPPADSIGLNYFVFTNLAVDSTEQLELLFDVLFFEGRSSFEILCRFDVTQDDLYFVHDYIQTEFFSFSIRDYGDDWLLMILL
jgi:hypothetical protein